MILSLLKTPVTLVARTEGAVSDMGEPEVSEASTNTIGHLAQRTTGENGQVVSEDLVLYLAAETVVSAWDAALVNGVEYEVLGHPWSAVNARTGRVSHVELTLRRAG